MVMRSYKWDIDSLKDARIMTRKKVPYNKVKSLIDEVKRLMRNELDNDVRSILASAGMSLNKILMK
jgi:hypothetical protein